MSDSFAVRVAVRGYELDSQGHLNSAVYLQYGDHARWECLRAAGISIDEMLATGIGPVTLETTIRFRHELRVGDQVDVSCSFGWGDGKTFEIRQEIRRDDGVLAAELISKGGLLALDERRLVTDPASHWRALATEPRLLGL
jgi:acyl-CoA thioester hydrolase